MKPCPAEPGRSGVFQLRGGESDQPFCLQSYAGTLRSKLLVARINSWSFLILQLLGCVRSTGIYDVYLLLRRRHYSGVRMLRTALPLDL